MAIMNGSYTYSAMYPTYIPANTHGGLPKPITEVTILDSSTHRVRADTDIRLYSERPLLCPASDGTPIRQETLQDFGVFPVTRPTNAMYRPNDVCLWDVVRPGATGLHASTNVFWMADVSQLVFTAARRAKVTDLSNTQKVVLRNLGDSTSTNLQVAGEQMSMWFYANGKAGYSFYIEYRRTRSQLGFSWSITVRSFGSVRAARSGASCPGMFRR
jgi:hypothetical protein